MSIQTISPKISPENLPSFAKRRELRAGDWVIFTHDVRRPNRKPITIPKGYRGIVIVADEEGVVVRLHCYYRELKHWRNTICLSPEQAKRDLAIHRPLLKF